MNQKDYFRLKQTMSIRNIPFDWKRMNVVRHHNRGESGETWKHYLAKCIAAKVLYDAGHSYFTELEMPNKAVTDLYDCDMNCFVEMESNPTDKKEALKLVQLGNLGRDVFVFDLREFEPGPEVIEFAHKVRKRLGL